MKKIIFLIVFIFSSSVLAETFKLECVCQSLQEYNFKTKKITKDNDCDYTQYTYINPEEKWVTSRGSPKDWRRTFTEITDDSYYYSNEEDSEIEYGTRAKAIEEGKTSIEEMSYYVKIDRYSLEWVDGLIYGEYFLTEQRFVPSHKDVNTFLCKKINKKI